MADNSLLEKMLDLPEFKIDDLKHNENDIMFYVSKKEKPNVCPVCGVIDAKLRVQQRRNQEVRDISILSKRVGLTINRTKYKCMECKSTFYETLDSVRQNSKMTTRFREYIAEQSKRRSFIELERELAISNVTIRNIFLDEAKKIPKFFEIETPNILGIDEIHIQREGKSRKQAWALICNGSDHTVIDMLRDRNKPTIIDFFSRLKQPYNVAFVTMDMWQPYRDAVYQALPQAEIIIDKFHVLKIVNEAFEKYRKSLKDKLGKRNVKLKKERYLLLSRPHKLNMKGIIYRDAWFSEFPELKVAYDLKEQFFNIYEATTAKEAVRKYTDWLVAIPDDLTIYNDTAKTVKNWGREIFNYFSYGRLTNAFVEGINNTIRAIEKQGRGYDFDVLRAKVIFFINHKIIKTSFKTDALFYSQSFTEEEINELYTVKDRDYGVDFKDLIEAINEGLL